MMRLGIGQREMVADPFRKAEEAVAAITATEWGEKKNSQKAVDETLAG